jgi:flavodoxin
MRDVGDSPGDAAAPILSPATSGREVVVLYASTHGTTRAVVKRLAELAQFQFDSFDVKDIDDAAVLRQYRLFLFFAPTYGNEELQPDMERFLINVPLDMSDKWYAVCELGNYYGFDKEFGALKIIRHHLQRWCGKELIGPLSMDTLPKKDWQALTTWCGRLNAMWRGHHE